MKRRTAWILISLCVLIWGAAAGESAPDPVLEQLSGLEWSFSSGVGAWSTELRIRPDGTFTGEYHDSDMGESGETFPEGTVYSCTFHGRFVPADQADGFPRRILVDSLEPDENQPDGIVRDGIRFVLSVPYGLSAGDEMLVYQPGTAVSAIPEELRFWTHLQDGENPAEALDSWFLCSEQNGSGFIGYAVPEETGPAPTDEKP